MVMSSGFFFFPDSSTPIISSKLHVVRMFFTLKLVFSVRLCGCRFHQHWIWNNTLEVVQVATLANGGGVVVRAARSSSWSALLTGGGGGRRRGRNWRGTRKRSLRGTSVKAVPVSERPFPLNWRSLWPPLWEVTQLRAWKAVRFW